MSESENNLYQYTRESLIFFYSRALWLSYALMSRETFAHAISTLLLEVGLTKYREIQATEVELAQLEEKLQ